MSKERLEKIEKNLYPLGSGMGDDYISVNDIYWLVEYAKEQTKRVQELEEENKRYREALSIISANLPLDGKEHYVYIARKALEGESDA